MIRWLTDYHACYIANIELYCGFDLGQYLRTHEHLVSLYIYRPFVEKMLAHRVDMDVVMQVPINPSINRRMYSATPCTCRNKYSPGKRSSRG